MSTPPHETTFAEAAEAVARCRGITTAAYDRLDALGDLAANSAGLAAISAHRVAIGRIRVANQLLTEAETALRQALNPEPEPWPHIAPEGPRE